MRQLRTFAFLAAVFAIAAFGRGIAGQSMQTTDEFSGLHFRSIGPAQASGRIADIAVYEPNPAIFYVGSAHGGVWKPPTMARRSRRSFSTTA
jgi:hypothetical protein